MKSNLPALYALKPFKTPHKNYATWYVKIIVSMMVTPDETIK
jgi:hypothetical protein